MALAACADARPWRNAPEEIAGARDGERDLRAAFRDMRKPDDAPHQTIEKARLLALPIQRFAVGELRFPQRRRAEPPLGDILFRQHVVPRRFRLTAHPIKIEAAQTILLKRPAGEGDPLSLARSQRMVEKRAINRHETQRLDFALRQQQAIDRVARVRLRFDRDERMPRVD